MSFPHMDQGGQQALHGHIPGAVAGLKPMGRMAGTNRLDLAIGLPLRNGDRLAALLRQVSDPASPNFRHYLTTEQFGPSEADYQSVIAFAKAQGLNVTGTHANRMLLDVNGAVSDVERALHVKMRVYQHPTENRTFYAPDSEPSIDLATLVLDVTGLQNYSRPKPQFVKKAQVSGQQAQPNAGSGPEGTYMGKDFRAAYAPDTTMTGAGQTVGLLQFDGYTPADITAYESEAGLSSVTLSNVLLDGFDGQPSGDGGEVEVSLDIEMSISMAPGLSEVIVYMAGPEGNFHDILNRMADDNLAKQLSCSWYDPSEGADPVAEQIFQQMAAQGQSFFAACGDYDAYTGPFPFPDDSPSITLVGGTTLTTTGPGGAWASETVWNWGGGIGTGGSISTYYAIPSYQTNISMTANQGSVTMRNVPDVALTADNVDVRVNGGDQSEGGTSCASPLWAGFTALVNQRAVMSGRPTVGFINPALDAIGTGQNYSPAFHDISTGNNTSPARPNKFFATTGFDLCAGWGVPNGQSLITALGTPDSLGVLPDAGFTAVGGSGGPFTQTSENIVLTNSGSNSLAWSIVNTSIWLTVSSSSGTLAGGGPATTVTASLSSGAYTLPLGNYSADLVISNNTTGIAQTRQFALQVVPSVPPAIVTQPSNQTVFAGFNAAFNVSVSGTPPYNYQWNDNGTNIEGATNAALTLTNLQPNNFGAYAVIVSNEVSAVTSSNAQLTVYGAPVIYTQPQNATVLSPARASLTVNAWGLPAPTFQWLVNGVGVPGGIGPVLTITNTVPSDGGSYSVLVSNSLGSIVSSNAVLLVNYLMETSQGQSQELATTNLTAPSSVQPSNTFTVSSVDSASLQGGELQLGGGNITYTRPGPFEGEDSFSYVLTPASGPPIQAGVTVLVNASLILGATMNASQVTIQFAGVPGTTYAIEASTDLVNWTVVGTAQAGPNGLFQFPDVNTGQYPQRYYRTVMF